MKKMIQTALLTATLSLSPFVFAETTPSFTPSQVTALQKIIHDYIVQNPSVLVEASKTLQAQQEKKMESAAMDAIAQNKAKIFEISIDPACSLFLHCLACAYFLIVNKSFLGKCKLGDLFCKVSLDPFIKATQEIIVNDLPVQFCFNGNPEPPDGRGKAQFHPDLPFSEIVKHVTDRIQPGINRVGVLGFQESLHRFIPTPEILI